VSRNKKLLSRSENGALTYNLRIIVKIIKRWLEESTNNKYTQKNELARFSDN